MSDKINPCQTRYNGPGATFDHRADSPPTEIGMGDCGRFSSKRMGYQYVEIKTNMYSIIRGQKAYKNQPYGAIRMGNNEAQLTSHIPDWLVHGLKEGLGWLVDTEISIFHFRDIWILLKNMVISGIYGVIADEKLKNPESRKRKNRKNSIGVKEV